MTGLSGVRKRTILEGILRRGHVKEPHGSFPPPGLDDLSENAGRRGVVTYCGDLFYFFQPGRGWNFFGKDRLKINSFSIILG